MKVLGLNDVRIDLVYSPHYGSPEKKFAKKFDPYPENPMNIKAFLATILRHALIQRCNYMNFMPTFCQVLCYAICSDFCPPKPLRGKLTNNNHNFHGTFFIKSISAMLLNQHRKFSFYFHCNKKHDIVQRIFTLYFDNLFGN